METTWDFVKVKKINKINIDYGWMLKISKLDQVLLYHQTTGMNRNSKVIKQCKDVFAKKKHFTDRHAAGIHLLAEIKNWSIVDTLVHMTSITMKNQLDSISHHGAIYINRNGSYFPNNDNVKEYDKKTSKFLVFPTDKESITETDIKVLLWPGGTHYYAKIGETDVVIKGQQKWDTWDKAFEAAKLFLKHSN